MYGNGCLCICLVYASVVCVCGGGGGGGVAELTMTMKLRRLMVLLGRWCDSLPFTIICSFLFERLLYIALPNP